MGDVAGYVGLILIAAGVCAAIHTRRMRLRGIADWRKLRLLTVVGFVLAFCLLVIAGQQMELEESPAHYAAGVQYLKLRNPRRAIAELERVSQGDRKLYPLAQAKIAEAKVLLVKQLVGEARLLAKEHHYAKALNSLREAKRICNGDPEVEKLELQYEAIVSNQSPKASVSNQIEKSSRTPKKRLSDSGEIPASGVPKKVLGMVDIKPDITYSNGWVIITNNDRFAYTEIILTLNPRGLFRGYHLRISKLGPR